MKKDLLLLHGAIGSKDQFSPLLPFLEENFNCFSLNFNGHGDRELPDNAFSIELFADDVLQWMQEYNKQTIDIFGYSMGGYVALFLAHLYPEKVGKIFTLSTKYNWTEENSKQEVRLLNPEKIEEKIPKFAQLLDNRHKDWKKVLHKTAEMMLVMGLSAPLTSKILKTIEHKVLVATGDSDLTATIQETINTYQLLQHGHVFIIPQCLHPFEQIDHEIIATHILKFFDRQ